MWRGKNIIFEVSVGRLASLLETFEPPVELKRQHSWLRYKLQHNMLWKILKTYREFLFLPPMLPVGWRPGTASVHTAVGVVLCHDGTSTWKWWVSITWSDTNNLQTTISQVPIRIPYLYIQISDWELVKIKPVLIYRQLWFQKTIKVVDMNRLTVIRVRQEAGAADAGGEEVWRRVLHLVALFGCALPARHLARSILRVREPPNRLTRLLTEAELLGWTV